MSFSDTAPDDGRRCDPGPGRRVKRVRHRPTPGSASRSLKPRRTVQPGRTTTVVSYSSTSIGPVLRCLADRLARAHRRLDRLGPRRTPARVPGRSGGSSSSESRSTALDGPRAARRRARITIGEPGSPRTPYSRSCSSSNAAMTALQVGRARAELDLDLPGLAAVAELRAAQPLDLRPPATAAPARPRAPRTRFELGAARQSGLEVAAARRGTPAARPAARTPRTAPPRRARPPPDPQLLRDPAACTGPAPPKATSANSRGSRPLGETDRSARIIEAFASRYTPAAASSSAARAARRPARPPSRRARPRSDRPPATAPAGFRPSTRFASVTVGSSPPRP